ncbi:MAG: hypothetical protein IBJ03_07945 [Gemmatimonadaceae bacterium]|nr:hypothetical protein [Gemmatimonadaceae bacterium]
MCLRLVRPIAVLSALMLLASSHLAAQGGHVHTPGMQHTPGMTPPSTVTPTQGGQATFAAIAEIVRLLEADSTTDWSKVNIEALRQHLIDMDAVVMRAQVTSTPVTGGARFAVSGTGATVSAIQRMSRAHGNMLSSESGYTVTTRATTTGALVTITATSANDSRTTQRIRALGFVGLLTSGEHHGPHHLAMARGMSMAGHGH